MKNKRLSLIVLAIALIVSIMTLASCGLIEQALNDPMKIVSLQVDNTTVHACDEGIPQIEMLVTYADGTQKVVIVTEDMIFGDYDFSQNGTYSVLIIYHALSIRVTLTVYGAAPIVPDDPVVSDPDDQPTDQDTPREKMKVYFISPVNYTGVDLKYTSDVDGDMFVYNPTLGAWVAHKAVDLLAADGAEVVAMYDGVVVECDESPSMGNYVVIDHGEGVLITYASLINVQVISGQKVKQGEVIGEVSTSAGNECDNGTHLHLEVLKNGQKVDPMPYVLGEIYREVQI